MAALTPQELHQHALELLYNSGHVIGIIPQSMIYGVYAALMSISSYMMLKKGLKTRARRILFIMTLVMFAYATIYMGITTTNIILFIRGWFLDADAPGPKGDAVQLFSAIGLINYVLTDGVVVWRAWVLCHDDHRTALTACVVFLSLASSSVITTIGIRIALMVHSPEQTHKSLARAIDVTQVANLVFSLITNILALSVVAAKAWRHRRFFTEMRIRNSKTHASRVMALLIESGIFYCISLITVLAATLIHLPVGTFGDLYTPVNVQLAGIYPVIVLLLVNQERSLDRTVFVNGSAALHVGGLSTIGGTTAQRTNVPISSVIFRSQVTSEGLQSSRMSSQMSTVAEPHLSRRSEGESFYSSGTTQVRGVELEKDLPTVPLEAFETFGVSVDEMFESKRRSFV